MAGAKTPRHHLPGDITFYDASAGGLVLAAHGALKSVGGNFTNELLTSIHDFAEYGTYETIVAEKMELELEIEAPSYEIISALTGADITVAGYEPHFGEVVGPCVAGVAPPLANIPLLPNSEIVRKSSSADGRTITGRLINAATALDGYYTAVDATGVISCGDVAYILYLIVNYAKYNAAAGKLITTDPTAVLDPMDIVVLARAWEPALAASEKGGVAIKFANCEVTQKPMFWKVGKEVNTITPKFNVGGPISMSTYTT